MESVDLSKDKYDYTILGSGIGETILSAAMAMIGKKVLHLDYADTYGGIMADYNFKQYLKFFSENESKKEGLVELIEQCNKFVPEEITDALSKDCTIELFPKCIFAKSMTVDVMLSSGVSDYFEFKSVDTIIILNEERWMEIPLSKSEIFQSESLSLLEKRKLVKFIEYCLGYFDKLTENQAKSVNSTHVYEAISVDSLGDIEAYAEKPILEYMNKLKLNDKLVQILLYVIGCVAENQTLAPKPITTRDFVGRLSTYLRSIGQYGDTPMLVPIYSSSEFPQAYARTGCVFGAVFIVNKLFNIEKLNIVDKEYRGIKISIDANEIQSSHLIFGADYTKRVASEAGFAFSFSPYYTLQTIVIVTRPLLSSKEKPICIAIIPPGNSLLKNLHPIRIFQRKTEAKSMKKNYYYILYISLWTKDTDLGSSKEIMEKLLVYLQELSKTEILRVGKKPESPEPPAESEEIKESEPKEEAPSPEARKEEEKAISSKEDETSDPIKYYTMMKIKQINEFDSKFPNMTFCPSANSDIDTDNIHIITEKMFTSLEPEKPFLQRPKEYQIHPDDDSDEDEKLIKDLAEGLLK